MLRVKHCLSCTAASSSPRGFCRCLNACVCTGAEAIHVAAHKAGGGERASQQDRACHQVCNERLAEGPLPADHRKCMLSCSSKTFIDVINNRTLSDNPPPPLPLCPPPLSPILSLFYILSVVHPASPSCMLMWKSMFVPAFHHSAFLD